MKFVETSVFTKQITALVPDDGYRLLQSALIVQPKLGDVIRGSGGLRKVRWRVEGKGKRGGVRIIYYYFSDDEHFFMLLAYRKNAQADLTPDQLKQLRSLVEEEFK